MAKTRNLFISHSWAYGDAYDKLVGMLDGHPNFSYSNYSVPKGNPIHSTGTDKELYAAIKNKIALCNAVLILAGVYSSYSKWIQKEIVICTREFSNKKPIVAIQPWGSEKTSKIVKENADIIVGWNSASIVKAIREVSP